LKVFSKEEAIMRAQQLELIYSQSGLLYEVFPDAPQYILDKAKHKSGPHADGIVGSTQAKPTDQLSNQLQQFSIQQKMTNQTPSSVAPPTQTSYVHNVQLTNPKANQQPEGKKKKLNKKGKEAINPSVPLQIKKTMSETLTRIPKGAFKKASHNLNTRATQNYSVVENLSQTPCTMSSLEVL
jgi:hypothetical protein